MGELFEVGKLSDMPPGTSGQVAKEGVGELFLVGPFGLVGPRQ